jgi:peptidoglycan hydrolase-like protein with peptidoglycan-binding domain
MTYVIKPGDTLFLIATRFNTTIEELLRLNPLITDPDVLRVGQIIRIPDVPTPPVHCPVLRQGATGPAVIQLQTALKAAGFDPGPLDGVFGPRTEAAVIAFQKSKNLLVDGVVGPQTWAALGVICPSPPANMCPTLNLGSTGPAVRRLQQLLTTAGFNPGAIDGIFGPKTQAAVLAFQGSRNLVQDGIVGIQTWTALGVQCRP